MTDNLSVESPRRFQIGKMGISVVTMEGALRLLVAKQRERKPAYLCAANVEATVLSQRDPDYCRIQNQSFLTLADSMPLRWYARMMGEAGVQRVSGPDLMIEVLRLSAQHGFTHYFYGDTEETLEKVRLLIEERFPGTRIVGMHSPPFRPPTKAELNVTIDEINALEPSFVWVALGCPKQERWTAQVFPSIKSSIVCPVGAALRFLIGEYRHAPKALQVCGLEGVYWRGFTHPIQSAKWYGYHVPAFGSLFVAGLARKLTQTV